MAGSAGLNYVLPGAGSLLMAPNQSEDFDPTAELYYMRQAERQLSCLAPPPSEYEDLVSGFQNMMGTFNAYYDALREATPELRERLERYYSRRDAIDHIPKFLE